VSYFNYGVSKSKLGDPNYARKIFQQGRDISKKYNGDDHYFTQKFNKRVQEGGQSSQGGSKRFVGVQNEEGDMISRSTFQQQTPHFDPMQTAGSNFAYQSQVAPQ
jgi:hypothetical protein